MPRTLSAAVLAELASRTIRPVWFAEIEIETGTLYFWTGFHEIVWDGHTWSPVGYNGQVSPITDSEEIVATGVQLQLSGIDSTLVGAALGSVRQNLSAKVYLGFLDDTDTLLVDPGEAFVGFTDVPHIEDDAQTATITISCESQMVALSRRISRRYTHEDQQIDYAGDLGFEYVVALAQGTLRLFSDHYEGAIAYDRGVRR